MFRSAITILFFLVMGIPTVSDVMAEEVMFTQPEIKKNSVFVFDYRSLEHPNEHSRTLSFTEVGESGEYVFGEYHLTKQLTPIHENGTGARYLGITFPFKLGSSWMLSDTAPHPRFGTSTRTMTMVAASEMSLDVVNGTAIPVVVIKGVGYWSNSSGTGPIVGEIHYAQSLGMFTKYFRETRSRGSVNHLEEFTLNFAHAE